MSRLAQFAGQSTADRSISNTGVLHFVMENKRKMASLGYRAEIDGLRTVAVIPVVLFHMGFQWIQGGYLGVDVFFVISGYLITTIILNEHDEGRFTFKQFWSRRVRRILPALLVMLVVTSIASMFLLFKGDTSSFAFHAAAAALSCANCTLVSAGSYWGARANESPYLHTWSLSVEEQFYLLYPFLVVLLIKFARKWLSLVLALIVVCSFCLYVWGSIHHPTRTFYLLYGRAWELGSGCLLATYRPKVPRVISQSIGAVLALTGLITVAGSFFLFSDDHSFTGHLAIPVLGSVLIIAFGDRAGFARSVLAHPLAVAIGKMSYSLYLWHWPLIVLANRFRDPLGKEPNTLVLLLLILLVSVVSYKFIEVPARRASIQSPALRFTTVLFCLNLVLAFYLKTRPQAYDVSMYAQPEWRGNSYSSSPVDGWAAWSAVNTDGISATARDASVSTAYYSGGIIKRYGGPTPEIVLLGDSHALMWAGTIDQVAADLKLTASFYASYGVKPFIEIPIKRVRNSAFFTSEQKFLFDTKLLECLTEWKPKVVVIAVRWSEVCTLPSMDLIEFIGRNGSKILLIEQPPESTCGNKNLLKYLSYLGIQPDTHQRKTLKASQEVYYELGRKTMAEICRTHEFCSIVPTADIFLSDLGEVFVLEGRDVLYIDDDHVTQFGAEKARQRICDSVKSSIGLVSKPDRIERTADKLERPTVVR